MTEPTGTKLVSRLDLTLRPPHPSIPSVFCKLGHLCTYYCAARCIKIMYIEHSYILFLCTRPERCCLLVNACPDWQPPPKSQTWTTDRTRPNNQLVNKWKSPSVRHKSTAQDVSSVANPGLSLVGSVQIFRQVALSLKPWILRQVCAPKEFIIRRTVRGDRKERITSPIVASDGIVVLSFFDRTLIALLTRIQPLFWPI